MTAHGEETRSLLDGLSAAGAQERGVSARRPAASRRRWRSTGRIFWSLGRRGATPPPPPAGDRAGRGRAVLPAARHPAGAAIPGHPPPRSVRRVEGPHPVTLRPHHPPTVRRKRGGRIRRSNAHCPCADRDVVLKGAGASGRYSHPRSRKAERSAPGGAYQPPDA